LFSQRACEEVFERLRSVAVVHRQFCVRVAALDVRGEHVIDLLAPDTQRSLPVLDSAALGGVCVPTQCALEAASADEALALVQQALRVRAALQQRVVLGRAHTVIDLHVDSRPLVSAAEKTQSTTAASAAAATANLNDADAPYAATLRFVCLAALTRAAVAPVGGDAGLVRAFSRFPSQSRSRR
jgi:hypothetical protein